MSPETKTAVIVGVVFLSLMALFFLGIDWLSISIIVLLWGVIIVSVLQNWFSGTTKEQAELEALHRRIKENQWREDNLKGE